MFLKHLIIFFVFCLKLCVVVAQDTAYFDSKGKKTTDISQASLYRIAVSTGTDSLQKKYVFYTLKHQLYYEKNYSDYKKGVKNGLEKEWDTTGNYLKKTCNYINNQLNGSFYTYWPNGKLKRADTYANDNWVSGQCYSSTGADTPYYAYEEAPAVSKQMGSLQAYFTKYLKYPKNARMAEIEGTVYVEFDITENGEVKNAYVSKSVNNELDAEALRLIERMPAWNPGKREGVPAVFKYRLPVRFALGY